jgi:di/tricarboxylate transporter
MDPPLSWLEWFSVSLPVASISIIAIWAFLHVNYRWEPDLMIPRMRKNTDSLSRTHYFVLFVSLVTIALWCVEKNLEWALGDMGIIAVIPLLAFFGTGILSKVRESTCLTYGFPHCSAAAPSQRRKKGKVVAIGGDVPAVNRSRTLQNPGPTPM